MQEKINNRFCWPLFVALLIAAFTCSANAGSLDDGQAKYDVGAYKQAIKILKPMANKNNTEAQNLMGLIYAKGNKNVPVNDNKAVFWFNKAATLGHSRASRNLAYMEANGRGSETITLSDDTADEDDCEE